MPIPIPARLHPRPRAPLTWSEVVTLVIFSQWARFRSERDFYRYAASQLRPAFPTLPRRSRFNRLTRRHYGTPDGFPRHPVSSTGQALDSSGVPTRSAKRRGASWLAGQADIGWSNRLAGMKASTCCFRSIPRASSPASALAQPASKTRPWPKTSSPSGILPIPGCPLWGNQPGAGM